MSSLRVWVGPVLLLGAACSAASPSSSRFSISNARAHVRALASDIGSRPSGTPANARARGYIVEQTRASGFDVRLQEADGIRPLYGASARVTNVIATRPGRRGETIALVTHYDSVPDGPGAADDALGVAVCLEAGRVLAQRETPNYALALVFTDGEEMGLMGASALMRDPIINQVRAVLNFEAVGSAGPSLLFQATGDSGALLRAWAEAAPQPAGARFMSEIYRRLPYDTDLTLFGRARVPALNFAAAGDSYTYHTPRDTADRLATYTIGQTVQNAIAVVEALDRSELSRREATLTYFDVLGTRAFAYGLGGQLVLFAAALLLGFFGWIQTLTIARQTTGLGRVIITALWAVAGVAGVTAGMFGAAWLLRATRETYQPWYAHPDRFFLFEAIAGVFAGWLLVRIGAWLPRGAHASTHPAVTWSVVLPFWMALAVAAQILVPSAAHLAVVPLGIAGLALAVFSTKNLLAAHLASAIALAAAAVLWVPGALLLLHFAVPVLGRLPFVTPLAVYPAVLAVSGLFVVPACVALVAHRNWRALPAGLTGIILSFALVAACAWCWFSPAYTDARPLERVIRYVNDVGQAEAYWEIGANEPGIDLERTAPVSGGFQGTSGRFRIGTPLDHLQWPFAYRGRSSIAQAPPMRVTGSMTCDDADCDVEITAVPDVGGQVAVFTLPAGVEPAGTNLAGIVENGTYRAIYAAVPPDGVTFRARVARADGDKMKGARVVAIASGLPGATWPALPGWLPQQHVVWHARSYFVIPVPLAPMAQP